MGRGGACCAGEPATGGETGAGRGGIGDGIGGDEAPDIGAAGRGGIIGVAIPGGGGAGRGGSGADGVAGVGGRGGIIGVIPGTGVAGLCGGELGAAGTTGDGRTGVSIGDPGYAPDGRPNPDGMGVGGIAPEGRGVKPGRGGGCGGGACGGVGETGSVAIGVARVTGWGMAGVGALPKCMGVGTGARAPAGVARETDSPFPAASREMVMTPPQTAHRARTLAPAIFPGSMRKTDRHSGQETFMRPLPRPVARRQRRRGPLAVPLPLRGRPCAGRWRRPSRGGSWRNSSFRWQVRLPGPRE
jgi:hypothetical protein